jgi:hypothetical protein
VLLLGVFPVLIYTGQVFPPVFPAFLHIKEPPLHFKESLLHIKESLLLIKESLLHFKESFLDIKIWRLAPFPV